MTTSPHERAVALALAANDGLGDLFDTLGSADDPRGVYGLYTLFLALLRELFDTPERALLELARMEAQIADELSGVMTQAALLGTTIGAGLLSVYGLEAGPLVGPLVGPSLASAALGVVMGIVRSQIGAARVALLTDLFDAAAVLGDADHVGILSAGPVVREATRWAAATANGLELQTIDTAIGPQRGDWALQAVAAIDERTTDCCLKVHGQVIAVDGGLFHLTGEPRFADDMPNPPFHHFCRSGIALVKMNDATDALTRDMIDAAYDEFKARKTKDKTPFRVPSSATSRRG